MSSSLATMHCHGETVAVMPCGVALTVTSTDGPLSLRRSLRAFVEPANDTFMPPAFFLGTLSSSLTMPQTCKTPFLGRKQFPRRIVRGGLTAAAACLSAT